MIAENINKIRQQITEFETKYDRKPGSVSLLAVSKTRPVKDIAAALKTNQYDFGENYLQDALEKITVYPNAHWHFIGPIQSNKTRAIAEHFDWVHTVDRIKIARRLSDQRAENSRDLNICIQVNSSGEESKSGVNFDEVEALAFAINELPRIKLRGLMTIPTPTKDFEKQREEFRRVREIKDRLNESGIQLDTLSMGMTNDIEAAIAEGATIVRIGTAIFGSRN